MVECLLCKCKILSVQTLVPPKKKKKSELPELDKGLEKEFGVRLSQPFFLAALGFELRGSHLQGRHS
jgi:hypothetical protein